mgnify:CR=1 FL=1
MELKLCGPPSKLFKTGMLQKTSNKNMLYADIKRLHVITIMLVMHVDIICIACRRNRRSGLVGRAFASHAEDLDSIPGRDRPKSFKQIVTAQLSNAWQQVLVLRVFRDDHVNRCYVSQ